MATYPKKNERREHPRTEVKSSAYVIDSVQAGTIVDISLGGISYISVHRKSEPEKRGVLELVIGDDPPTRITELPYRQVNESIFKPDRGWEGLTLKRRHLAFESLSQKKIQLLECFINGAAKPDSQTNDNI